MGFRHSLVNIITDKIEKRYGLESVSTIISLIPKWMIPQILARYGAQIGDDVIVSRNLKIENSYNGYKNLSIGQKSYIGFETLFDLTGQITIEEYVTLAPRCTILTHQDVGDRPLAKIFKPTKEHTILRKGCWIGAGVIILGGIEVGENAVIGAGSVVTSNIEPFSVYAGVPARLIKRLNIDS